MSDTTTLATQNTAIAVAPTTSLITGEAVKKIEAIEAFVSQNALASTLDSVGSIMASAQAAAYIGGMRKLLTPDVVAYFLELQGSTLGFKTDKDTKGGYDADTVRDVVIEASARGFDLVMNRTNIISGRFYATKEGLEDFFRRKFVKNGRPRVTDIRLSVGVPKLGGDRALVAMSISFKFDGRDEKMSREIPVRVNGGMGDDAIIGKATRKILKDVYAFVTGSEITDSEDEPKGTVTIVGEARTVEDYKGRLEAAFGADEAVVNSYLIHHKKLNDGQTFRDLNAVDAAGALERAAAVIEKAKKLSAAGSGKQG
jgi:hypothetical protein